MRVIFWDRKNGRKVSNVDLMQIKLVEEVMTGCRQENEFQLSERTLGSIGYKSEDCPKEQNWNKWCNLNDLVFLCLEYEPEQGKN